MKLLDERDAVLRQICEERVEAELPGESSLQRFARRVALSALLGVDVGILPNEVRPTESLPLAITVSPETSVEPVISESPAEIAEVQGATAGETREEETPSNPSPVPPKPQKKTEYVNTNVAPITVRVLDTSVVETGSSDALYQARFYVLTQIEKKQPIDAAHIARYTGWDAPTVRKFVCELQDEMNQKKYGRPGPKTNQEGIQEGFDALAKAIYAPETEEEPDAIALEDIEAEEEEAVLPTPKNRDRGKRGGDPILPDWFAGMPAKFCKSCNAQIVPKRISNGYMESPSQFKIRVTCNAECSAALRSVNYQKQRKGNTE